MRKEGRYTHFSKPERLLALVLCLLFICPPDLFAAFASPTTEQTDSVQTDADKQLPGMTERLPIRPEELSDTATNVVTFDDIPGDWIERRGFNPSPDRALWLSVLFPGLGQIYNRRYWKLPIIAGGFMGLGYATNWNNNQLQDYTNAYRDATDNDPATNSYMNFFPPTTTEDQIDMRWLQQTMKSRKDYYRRNRDLCIISLVGLYLLCVLDAYVDASLYHFDISEDLSLDMQPAVMITNPSRKPAVGITWAFNF